MNSRELLKFVLKKSKKIPSNEAIGVASFLLIYSLRDESDFFKRDFLSKLLVDSIDEEKMETIVKQAEERIEGIRY